MTSKHPPTQTPWETFYEPTLNKIRIQKNDGIIPYRTIAHLSCQQDNPSKYEQESNAALICKAVNNYAPLLGILKMIDDADGGGELPHGIHEGHTEALAEWKLIVSEARALLAKLGEV